MRKKNAGFTLIELLVVVAIIGILASISIPQFAEYRRRGIRQDIQAAVKSAATAEEVYYTDHDTYSSTCNNLPGFADGQNNVRLACDGTSSNFVITGSHPYLPDYSCIYRSDPLPGYPNMICS